MNIVISRYDMTIWVCVVLVIINLNFVTFSKSIVRRKRTVGQ